MAPSLSVVIPTLNAAGEIDELLTLIETQTLRPFDILVVDSSSEDGTVDEVAKHPRVNFVRIERKEFNHGSTRDIALRHTAGDFVCFLTQDAVPASSRYLETLVEPLLADNSVALVSGRQLPKANARRFEQLVRDFNYPDAPSVRSKGDLENLGLRRSLHLTPVLPIDGPHISNAVDSIMSTPTRTCSWPPSLSPRV